MSPTLRESVIRIVGQAFPQLVYGYPRTYVVAAVDAAGRLDLVPPPGAAYLPELPAVEQWSLGGATIRPAVGSTVTVLFRDAMRDRPIVVHWDRTLPTRADLDATDLTVIGASSDEVYLGGSPREQVHRVGDTGTAGSWTVQNTVSPPAPAGVAFTYTPPSGAPTTFILVGAVTVQTSPTTVDLETEALTGSSIVSSG